MYKLNPKEKMLCVEVVKKALIYLNDCDLQYKSDFYENYLTSYMFNSELLKDCSDEFINHCSSVAISICKESIKIFYEQIYLLN